MLSLEIYKKGQGYWTRTMSAVGYGFLIIAGAIWAGRQIQAMRVWNLEAIYVQLIAGSIFFVPLAVLGYYLFARHQKFVDFLIATEGEMKKVNWSTRRELLGSTWVVIGLTVFLALLCFVFDFMFFKLFNLMNVIETGT